MKYATSKTFALSLTAALLFFAVAAPAQVEIGAYVGNPDHVAPTADEVNGYENLIGRKLSSVLVYWAWNDGDFPTQALTDSIKNHDGFNSGTTLQLTWEPWSRAGGNDSSFSLDKIINGNFDSYITKFADDAAAWGDPIRLRFMHEMIQDNDPNTPGWYPWQDQPVKYIQAWDHVYDIFKSQGANNVQFVWAPNNFPADIATLKLYYPGANKVDLLGMDGYNAGEDGLPGWPYWQNFDDIFFNLYHAFVNNPQLFGDKKIILAEFASAEAGGSKADWITQAFARIKAAYPDIMAYYWFNKTKEATWNVDSSPASLAAFQAAMLDSYYISSAVPEPGTLSLLSFGLTGVLLILKRRKN